MNNDLNRSFIAVWKTDVSECLGVIMKALFDGALDIITMSNGVNILDSKTSIYGVIGVYENDELVIQRPVSLYIMSPSLKFINNT